MEGLGTMCKDTTLLISLFDWHGLRDVARDFSLAPKKAGVYSVKVRQEGDNEGLNIIAKFMRTPYYKALKQLDEATKQLFTEMVLPSAWVDKTTNSMHKQALGRLMRLESIGKSGQCPIVYIGSSNNLRRRLDELAYGGHTANAPIWALMLDNWQLDWGWYENVSYKQEEERLKGIFRNEHDGTLPLLMER